jgi:hypothetical protein
MKELQTRSPNEPFDETGIPAIPKKEREDE